MVDDFSHKAKENNYILKTYYQKIETKNFLEWFDKNYNIVDFVIHIGARTDTTEFNVDLFN